MRLALLATLALVAHGLTAQVPAFRADGGSAWQLSDNPAFWAEPGLLAAYFHQGTSDDVLALTPLGGVRWTQDGAHNRLEVGTGVGLPGLALGYRTVDTWSGGSVATAAALGLVWRPWDVLSLAATVEDAWGGSPTYGAGLAVRPLALAWPQGLEPAGPAAALTLAGDLTVTSAGVVAPGAVGARLALPLGGATLGLRGWYDLAAQKPGAEVTLGFGGAEARATVGTAPALGFGALVALEARPPTSPATVLRLRDWPALAAAPTATGAWASLLGVGSSPTVADLAALLRAAAQDPAVAAVAFENPPPLNGLADSQDLALAFAALRQAGKKVWVYADAYAANGAFQALWAGADRVALNPNGALDVHPLSTERLYYKDFFDKIGVKFVNLAPWETKSFNNDLTFASMPDGERAMNLRLLGELQAQLTEALRAGRGDRLRGDPLALVNAGPYLVPRQALQAGLVDAVEYRADFEEALTKDLPGAVWVDRLPSPPPAWGPSPFTKKVALVYLQGDMVLGPGTPGSIGSDAAEQIARLREDPAVAGLLLRVDSPGGVVITGDTIAEEVRKTVAAGKPVAVSMGTYGASGGYYVSAYASRIFARPGTITGSIGVTAALPSVAGALDKLGIHPDAASLDANAGFADPYREFRPADLQALGDEIASIYDRFLDVVAAGRKLSLDRVRALGEGQVWTGREALANGLVDELGTQEDARAWLEAQLGARVVLEPVVPGRVDALTGLEQLLPSAGVAGQLQRVAGATLGALDRLARLGVGPGAAALEFYDGAFGR